MILKKIICWAQGLFAPKEELVSELSLRKAQARLMMGWVISDANKPDESLAVFKMYEELIQIEQTLFDHLKMRFLKTELSYIRYVQAIDEAMLRGLDLFTLVAESIQSEHAFFDPTKSLLEIKAILTQFSILLEKIKKTMYLIASDQPLTLGMITQESKASLINE